MKIMITGAGGQLGNELVSILKSGKSEIGEIPHLYKNAEIVAVDVDVLDISDNAAVKRFVAEQRPDIIFNCAAMTNVDGCETMLDVAFNVNAVGVRNLAVAAESTGSKLVHLSTDYVFGGDAKVPYVEWDLINPQSIYGKSKALGEKYALTYSSKSFVVRTSWLYGYIGKNFVKTVIRIMKQNGKMSVVNDQRGNPTNANDLAHHLLKLAVSEEYGIYHCTGEGECTWYDLACEVVRLTGIEGTVSPCTSEEFPTPTKRPAYSSLNNLALSLSVGNEMREWKTALAAYIKNLKD